MRKFAPALSPKCKAQGGQAAVRWGSWGRSGGCSAAGSEPSWERALSCVCVYAQVLLNDAVHGAVRQLAVEVGDAEQVRVRWAVGVHDESYKARDGVQACMPIGRDTCQRRVP